MTDRLEELLWLELDGALTPDEVRELEALRADSSGAGAAGDAGKALEISIRDLADGLSRLEDVDPPETLKAGILAAVESARSRSKASTPTAGETAPVFEFPSRAASPSRRPTSRLQWSYLAAGFLLGAFVLYQFTARQPTKDGPSDFVGTIRSVPQSELAAVESSRNGAVPDLPAFVSFEEREGLLGVRLDLPAGNAVFFFRAAGLEVAQIEFLEGASGTRESGSDTAKVRAEGPGRIELLVALAEPERPFFFSASGDKLTPFEGEFSIHQLSSP